MKPFAAVLGALLLAGCVAPRQQPAYVTRPFTYARPAQPTAPSAATPAVLSPTTTGIKPDPVPSFDAAPEPVTASVPQPPAAAASQAASPIQKTTAPDSNGNVPMMGFRPMRGQKPPGA